MAIKYFKSKPNPHAYSTDFFAHGDPIDTDGTQLPSVEISLRKGEYEYADQGVEDPDVINHNYFAKQGEQLKLFDLHPSTLDNAFADHRMRAHTPTVLGMAVNEAKKLGYGLTYSHDLSEHSSKLAKRGMELGVVAPNSFNPNAEQLNDIAESGIRGYPHLYSPGWFQDYDEAQPEEVNAGRATIRGIVKQGIAARRGTKPQGTTKPLGPQFNTNNEQLKLPGFD